MKNYLLIFLLICTCPFYGFGQKKYTLNQLISIALENNISVLKEKNQVDIYNFDITKVKSAYLPNLNGSAAQQYNFGRSIDRTTNQFATTTSRNNYFSLSADATLFSGFQKYWDLKYAQLSAKSQSYYFEKIKRDVSVNVANQYLQILLLKEREKQIQTQLSSAISQKNKINIQFELGSLNKQKLLEANSTVSQEESSLVDIQNQLTTAFLNLKQTLNFNLADQIDLEEIKVDEIADNITENELNLALTDGLNNLPQVKQAQKTLEGSNAQIKSANAGYYPRLNMSGSLSTTYSSNYLSFAGYTSNGYQPIGVTQTTGEVVVAPSYIPKYSKSSFGNQLVNNLGQTLSFSLSIPIFNGLQTRYAVKQAKLNANTNNLALLEATQKAKSDIYIAHQSILNDRKKYVAAKNKVNSQKALFEQTDILFKSGSTSFFEFTSAKNLYDQAISELLNAKFQYLFDVKLFELYLGKVLSF